MPDPPAITLRWNDPFAVEVTAAVQRGQADRVGQLLERRPGLAGARVVKDGEAAGSRTLLHLFADWPGHRRHPSEIVDVLAAAGADLDAHFNGIPEGETPLHWAASNDDVELADALLDAGADIEIAGSCIGGLGPIANAAVFGGRRVGLRLVERGARTNIYQAAALGLMDRVQSALAARPGPDGERITTAFWAACGANQKEIAALLLAEGADINWVGWGEQTPLDLARAIDAAELVAWLQAKGARPATG